MLTEQKRAWQFGRTHTTSNKFGKYKNKVAKTGDKELYAAALKRKNNIK